MDVEFIKIFCYTNYFYYFKDLVYTNYHSFPQPRKNVELEKKINHWRRQRAVSEKLKLNTPPSVLILGLESVSRLNFIRNLKKTRKYLDGLGAVEMLGYTKGSSFFIISIFLYQ